ncbi:MAG TPA: hypothetical protein VGI46_20345 [Candidatus Acidoferrum sp.]
MFSVGLFCAQLMFFSAAQAQTNSYKQTNLVSDAMGLAPVIDPNLVNPWGICIIPGDPFWISDNASPTGVTSLYTNTGAIQGAFTIAPPNGSSNPATPTDVRQSLPLNLSVSHRPITTGGAGARSAGPSPSAA